MGLPLRSWTLIPILIYMPDCLDSLARFNSQAGPLSPIGGCWAVGADGSIRTINDGLVTSAGGQGFGGDSIDTLKRLESYIIPPEDKLVVNLPVVMK